MSYRTALIAACSLALCAGCSQETPWQAPAAGLITQNGAGLFYIVTEKDAGVIFFHDGDLRSSASHTSNSRNKTFDCTGKLTTESGTKINYRLVSSDAGRITIDGSIYDLGQGRCFQVSETGEISQLSFAPLERFAGYPESLKAYVSANSAAQPKQQFNMENAWLPDGKTILSYSGPA